MPGRFGLCRRRILVMDDIAHLDHLVCLRSDQSGDLDQIGTLGQELLDHGLASLVGDVVVLMERLPDHEDVVVRGVEFHVARTDPNDPAFRAQDDGHRLEHDFVAGPVVLHVFIPFSGVFGCYRSSDPVRQTSSSRNAISGLARRPSSAGASSAS